jgi:hypothetical protein
MASVHIIQDQATDKTIDQYSLAQILGIVVLTAAPMGLLAWVVFPALRDSVNMNPGIFLFIMLGLGLGLV